MIKYLGSKRKLLDQIEAAVAVATDGPSRVLDCFSGTSRVARRLKRAGHRVIASDANAYAATLARCYVAADAGDWFARADRLIVELNNVPAAPGYVTETFCERARYFQPKNGARIDAIRERIAEMQLEPMLEAIALTSLIEAADRVDSTTGVQMAYLKQWAPRSNNDLQLRVPSLLARSTGGACAAHCLDAFEAAETIEADIAYLDPPYNQHSYLGNYHVWESIVRWDKPEVYGIACKRVDCRERRSVFNSRTRFADAFERLIESIRAPRLVISFSNEGYLSRDALEEMLGRVRGGGLSVAVATLDYKRYVGAQIGIHDPRGNKVGRVSHLRNKEHLFVAVPSEEEASLEGLAERLGDAAKVELGAATSAR